MAGAAPLTLRILGGFELQRSTGAPVTLARPRKKAQALLAYLACQPGVPHLRDKVAAMFWSDRDALEARANLRQALSVVRAAVRDGLSVGSDAVTVVPGAVDVDVIRFEQLVHAGTLDSLQDAGELYRGDLLAGLDVGEPLFEEWLLAQRERLRELAIQAALKLAGRLERAGDREAAAATARRLLALDPLQEPVHRMLMRLYAELGRRDAALRQYQLCIDVLRRELDTEPEQQTRRLYQDILRSRAVLPPVAAAPIPARRASGMDAPAMIGRSPELGRLVGTLDDACAGAGRVIAVLGEAGIGKTRLVAELALRAAEREALVMTGHAYPGARGLPYASWVEAMRSSGFVENAEVCATLAPVWASELARLLPELAGERGPAADGPVAHLRVFESVIQFLGCAAASRPVVVVLEDLHWADEMSLRLLAASSRRLRSMRVLVVGTARDDELDDHEALREVLRHESVTRVTLAPLSAPETTALVRQLGGRRHEAEVARLAEQIWAGSGGNPFFAVETIRAIGQGTAIDAPHALPMPERVRELVVARLERLGETSQRLVPVAAVIGRDFGFELLRRAAGLPELEVVDGLEELVRRRVLRAAGERFDFVHDRIREIADERLLAPRRRLLHRQVAEAIEDLHADDLAPHTGALARHHLESGAWGRASVYLRDAANRAVAHAAYREAVPYFEQALAALERVPAAERRAQDAIDIRLEFRACLGILAELDRVDAILREAEALAEAAGDRARLRRVLNFRGSHHWWMARYHRAEEVFERVARLRPPGSAPSEMERWHIAVTRHALAEYRSAIDVLEESTVDGGDPAGAPLRRSLRMLYRVYSRVELGQFDAACADAERDFQEAMPHSYRLCLAAGARGFTLLRRGDALAAIASLEQAVSLAVEGSFRGFFPNAAGWLGLAYLAADRAGEALALLEDAVRRATPMSRGVSSVMLCEAYLRTDRLEEAGALAQDTLATTRRTSERGTEAWTLWLLGGIAARRRATRAGAASGPEARAWYDEALSLATELGMRPLMARCHVGLGSLPAGAGESSERGRHLEIALGMFEEMGMRS